MVDGTGRLVGLIGTPEPDCNARRRCAARSRLRAAARGPTRPGGSVPDTGVRDCCGPAHRARSSEGPHDSAGVRSRNLQPDGSGSPGRDRFPELAGLLALRKRGPMVDRGERPRPEPRQSAPAREQALRRVRPGSSQPIPPRSRRQGGAPTQDARSLDRGHAQACSQTWQARRLSVPCAGPPVSASAAGRGEESRAAGSTRCEPRVGISGQLPNSRLILPCQLDVPVRADEHLVPGAPFL